MTIQATPGQRALSLAILAPLLAAILQVLTPVLPQLGLGEPIGDQSDSVRTLITPAGWAFSIWGALYTGCFVLAIYQLLPAHRNSALLDRIRWPATGAFLGNAVWALYTQFYGLSLISALIILFTLSCLLVIYRTFAAWDRPFTKGERWCAVLPLSALASWLTVASIVNIAAALRYHGVDAGGSAPLIAAAIVVIGGVIAGAAIVRGRGNPPYALVFLWALSAIYAAGGQEANAVAVATMISAVIVVAATIIGLRAGGTNHWFGTSGRAAAGEARR